jgi:hypothetical protein
MSLCIFLLCTISKLNSYSKLLAGTVAVYNRIYFIVFIRRYAYWKAFSYTAFYKNNKYDRILPKLSNWPMNPYTKSLFLSKLSTGSDLIVNMIDLIEFYVYFYFLFSYDILSRV